MKFSILLPVSVLCASTAAVSADVPKKAPFSRYYSLYQNSPFTSKPVVEGPGAESNPLDDYALIGVSPIGGSAYRVTLINRKKPEERITVDSNNPKAEFKILGVTRKAGNPLGTEVRMRSGILEGTVAFDEKLLTLAAPKAAPLPQVSQPGQPVQAVQGQPGQAGQPGQQAQQGQGQNGQPVAQRQPRPRVVPPPTAPAAGGNPQVQQGQQGANQGRNIQRAQRRGNGN